MTSTQHIGLLMTYNEEDIIQETLSHNSQFFDAIYALDGSTDKTADIIRSFDVVKSLIKDQDLYPKRTIKDGVRQFLLEKAQAECGYEGWFTLLHGDELLVDDPRKIAAKADRQKAERINWRPLNFFLHTSQKDSYTAETPITKEVLFYEPGVNLEIRQFKNKKGIFYDLNQHNNLVPHGISWKPLFDFPIFRHYVVRSVKQFESRLYNASQSYNGFNNSSDKQDIQHPEAFDYNHIFRDHLFTSSKQVRKFDGDYQEFCPFKRPHFFKQYLDFHKYRA
ncbi:hypothetical protein CL657_02800 [bacterium]|nr:hypothetical protein [bacterium]|tara:strand:+ start:10317 stop:11153 length:837 start_codon:yes stop_codon:yes gene_type:complete